MRKVDPARQQEKRREILAAAVCCFERDGLRGATIADICAEAKISPGHLYYYFSSKEAIVEAMVDAKLDQAAAGLDRMMQGGNAVMTLVDEVARFSLSKGGVSQAFLFDLMAEAGRNPAIEKILRERTKTLRDLLADYLQAAQEAGKIDRSLDPGLTAAILLCTIDGLQSWPIKGDGLDQMKGFDLFKTLITRLLTPTAEGALRELSSSSAKIVVTHAPSR